MCDLSDIGFFGGGALIFLEARVEPHHTLTQCPNTRLAQP